MPADRAEPRSRLHGVPARRVTGTRYARHRHSRLDHASALANRNALTAASSRATGLQPGPAPGRVEKIEPALTSQRCSACGQADRDSRESQAVFRCTACGFAGHADVNAAINIAAGHAVTAGGGDGAARPVNREPQLLLQPV